jgi:hypothetical protein
MSVEIVLDIDTVWKDVVCFVDNTIPYVHGEFTTQEVKDRLLANEYNLMVIKNDGVIIGAIVFSTHVIAGKKTAFFVVGAGKNISTSDVWQDVITVLGSLGYSYIEAAMRDSTLRLWSKLGFEKKYNMAGVNI